MKDTFFHFKNFSVRHEQSAMKVGVDGVLIGAWTDIENIGEELQGKGINILDVGTGCGLIALIMNQKYPMADITAIDIDAPSVEEAGFNVKLNGKNGRITVLNSSLKDFTDNTEKKYDLIVSNPPFFDSGLKVMNTPRSVARHQGELSPLNLLRDGYQILKTGGFISLIFPEIYASGIISESGNIGYSLVRRCDIRNNEKKPYKRVMLQFQKTKRESIDYYETDNQKLTLFDKNKQPTEDYLKLCSRLYLKF